MYFHGINIHLFFSLHLFIFSGGTAIARPVATAIAGLSPSELSALGLPTQLAHKMTVPRYGLVYETNNWPLNQRGPSGWSDESFDGKNYDEKRIRQEGIPLPPDAERLTRNQLLSGVLNTHYNAPYSPYGWYLPLYK